jgi:hypothetical protein
MVGVSSERLLALPALELRRYRSHTRCPFERAFSLSQKVNVQLDLQCLAFLLFATRRML